MRMKRKVSCLFSLILILLVFCTLISPKAEQEMHTLAETRHAVSTGSVRNISVSNIAITWKDSGVGLYNIVEGDGWESGLRIAQIPPNYYTRSAGHFELGQGTDYWYLYSASREPKAGDSVTAVETIEKREDTYLLWHPKAVENLEKLPNSMAPLMQTENAALVAMKQGNFPFFEHNVWYTLREKMGEDIRIYSMSDAATFLQAIPWIAGVAAVLLCSLLLWGASWILLGKASRRKGLLWINVALIAGLLGALPWLVSQFDLPASLMPVESILDISHYAETFDRIFTALDTMGSTILADAVTEAVTGSVLALSLGAAAVAALVILERICLLPKKNRL